MTYPASMIANRFIELAKKNGKQLTNTQLQKLVYIANGFMLGVHEQRLYLEDTYAWPWGPVIKNLYETLRKYGCLNVTEYIDVSTYEGIFSEVSSDTRENEIIEAVWEGYGHLSGSQLSAITHRADTPWGDTWENNKFGVIPQETIMKYYQWMMA